MFHLNSSKESDVDQYRDAILASTGKSQPSWVEELLVDAYLGHSFNEHGEKQIEDGEIHEVPTERIEEVQLLTNQSQTTHQRTEELRDSHQNTKVTTFQTHSEKNSLQTLEEGEENPDYLHQLNSFDEREPPPPGTEDDVDVEVACDPDRAAMLLYEACRAVKDNPEDDKAALQEVLDAAFDVAYVDINSSFQCLNGRTLLMEAAKQGKVHCAELLLSTYDASPNCQTSQGRYTALHYACYNGHLEAIKVLLSNGADPFLKSVHEKTASQSSETRHHNACATAVEDFATYKGSSTGHRQNHPRSTGLLDVHAENIKYVFTTKAPSRLFKRPKTLRTFLPTQPPMPPEQNTAMSTFMYQEWQEDLGSYLETQRKELSSALVSALQEKTRTQLLAAKLCFKYDDQTWRLKPQNGWKLTLGRSRSNDLVLTELRASKVHAKIYFDPDLGYLLEDIGSRHGTFFNGTRMNAHEAQVIKEGDGISFGGPEIRVQKYVTPSVASKGFSANPLLFEALESKVGMKEHKRWKETKRLKRKLLGSGVKQAKDVQESVYAYRDRAKDRRQLHHSISLTNEGDGMRFYDEGDLGRPNLGIEIPGSTGRPSVCTEKGSRILQNLGWKDGEGLGRKQQGRKTALQLQSQMGTTGLGYGGCKLPPDVSHSLNSFNSPSTHSVHIKKMKERLGLS